VVRFTDILQSLAQQFEDHRNVESIEHSIDQLVKQRVMGTALGYEDINDHDAMVAADRITDNLSWEVVAMVI
jgi:hypothetical protein